MKGTPKNGAPASADAHDECTAQNPHSSEERQHARPERFVRLARWANRQATRIIGHEQTGRSALTTLILAAATGVTCLIAGAGHAVRYGAATGTLDAWRIAGGGAAFTAGLLGILILHEWGHLRQARRWNVRHSVPRLLPAPTLVGTFGAMMRIKSRPPNRKALFDIAAGGPLWGLALALPLATIGLWMSSIVSIEQMQTATNTIWNESALTAALRSIVLGPLDHGQVVALHPLAVAGTVGVLVTCFNLLPVGPLDGGHIMRALSGSRAGQTVSGGILTGAMLAMTAVDANWYIWAFVGVFLLALGEQGQIRPVDDKEPPDAKRWWTAAALGAVGVVGFTPAPLIWISG